jgi:hypothetical protein
MEYSSLVANIKAEQGTAMYQQQAQERRFATNLLLLSLVLS